jgi:Transglycosylase SLT domain
VPPRPRTALGPALALALASALALSAVPAVAEPPPPRLACEQAAEAAEANAHLPPGLLLAIGRVESGRYSPTLGRVAPWPWSVDFAGTGVAFATRDAALQAVRGALASGQRNIDVGCFQVNLGAHPDAFPDLRTALDPSENARFAAGFLSRLRARLGNWPAATAAYHSETASLGQPYLLAVMKNWANSGGAGASLAPPAPDRTWVLRTPVPGIHVVTPANAVVAEAGTMRIISPTATLGPAPAGLALPHIRYGVPAPIPQ